MDRAFMEHYFDLAFEDMVGEIVGDDLRYAELRDQAQEAIDALAEAVGGTDSPNWHLCEDIIGKLYLTQIQITKLAYLRGAEDREKMLR